ncbi:hypothetical protein L3073_02800 [Ancylomarina sp. DW003]|nr:hypothetical protein [Ancylomarina sp. DW003]MDE5421131.1 hypothetical protein [Ancylomarina sp. DW003]
MNNNNVINAFIDIQSVLSFLIYPFLLFLIVLISDLSCNVFLNHDQDLKLIFYNIFLGFILILPILLFKIFFLTPELKTYMIEINKLGLETKEGFDLLMNTLEFKISKGLAVFSKVFCFVWFIICFKLYIKKNIVITTVVVSFPFFVMYLFFLIIKHII